MFEVAQSSEFALKSYRFLCASKPSGCCSKWEPVVILRTLALKLIPFKSTFQIRLGLLSGTEAACVQVV